MSPLTPNQIGQILVSFSLIYQAIVFLVPSGVYLYNAAPTSPSLGHWASLHAWYFVFLSLNSVVFWFSMQSSIKLSLVETLGDWVVVGQIAWMTLAGSWVTNYDFTNPTVPIAGHQVRWGAALVTPALMNLFALYHTLYVFRQQGWAKEIVWVLMDLFAAAFYVLILVRLGTPAKLDPPNLAFLWRWIVLPIVVLTLIDVFVLRTRAG